MRIRDLAKAAAAYRVGSTSREIAAQLGVDASTVRRWVARVETLRRTGPRGRVDVSTELIVELRDAERLSFGDIATAVGMSKSGRAQSLPHRHGRGSPGPCQVAVNEHAACRPAVTGRARTIPPEVSRRWRCCPDPGGCGCGLPLGRTCL